MKKLNQFISAGFLAITLFACKPNVNNDVNISNYKNGIFVVNEGQFPNGLSALSYIDKTKKTVVSDEYKAKTNKSLGLLAQSVNKFGNKIYICVTNSNVVEVVSSDKFVAQQSIQALKPRYIHQINAKKAYISEWGNTSAESAIRVIDIDNSTTLKTIPVDPGAEEIVVYGNRAYVTCNGGFGSNNTIAIIDITTDALIAKIPVGPNPDGIVLDKENNIWILCTPQYDANFNKINDGKLVRLNTFNNTFDKSFTFVNQFGGASNLKINASGDMLYYNYDGGLYKVATSTPSIVPQIVRYGNYYGIGIDPSNNSVYVSDAKNFSAKGQVHRLGDDGSIIETYDVDVVPSEMHFID
jgi:YVTN family beta-propeller protein